MKRIIFLAFLVLPLFVAAQKDSIRSGVYNWKEPNEKSYVGKFEMLFEGQAHDMKGLYVSSSAFQFTEKRRKYSIVGPIGREELLIIRSGTMQVTIKDSSYTVGPGSVIFLESEKKKFVVKLQSDSNITCRFYTIRYISRFRKDVERGQTSGGSQVINWDTVTFKPNAKGGRRDFLNRSTTMSKRVEIHASTLKPGFKSHDPHTHIAPEIVIVTEGKTEMQIGNQFYPGKPGSVYFLASQNLHAIQNKGESDCTYFAIQLE